MAGARGGRQACAGEGCSARLERCSAGGQELMAWAEILEGVPEALLTCPDARCRGKRGVEESKVWDLRN